MDKKRANPSNLLVKECIVQALLQLTQKKPLSTITISELCEKAGVSRMTFYRNYESKEEIFTKHLAELFAEYKNDTYDGDGEGIYYDEAHMIHYFTSLYRYKDFLDGLLRCGFGTYFLEMIHEYLIEKWGKTADHYTLAAFSGSLYHFFYLWAKEGHKQQVEVLAHKLSENYRGSENILS